MSDGSGAVSMPPEAAEGVRDLVALCGARWSGQQDDADVFAASWSRERMLSALRWVPGLVGEALDLPGNVSRESFARMVVGQSDLWEQTDEKSDDR